MKVYAKAKENGKILPLFIVFAGLLALFKGVTALQSGVNGIVFIAIGILLIIVAIYRPVTSFDREGVDEEFKIAFISKHTMWKWSDINRMFADFSKAKPDVVLVLQKNGAQKKINVLREDVEQIIMWAAQANRGMFIQHNGNIDIDIPGRTNMSIDEYAAAKAMSGNVKPQNFHQFASEARKIKAEKDQIVAKAKRNRMLKKAVPKINEKSLKGWR